MTLIDVNWFLSTVHGVVFIFILLSSHSSEKKHTGSVSRMYPFNTVDKINNNKKQNCEQKAAHKMMMRIRPILTLYTVYSGFGSILIAYCLVLIRYYSNNDGVTHN